MHIESVACEDYACNVLSYIVYISLYGRYDYLRPTALPVVIVHVWFKDGYGVPHHLSGLHYLRQEHLSFSEELADCFHSGHEGSFDYLQCT